MAAYEAYAIASFTDDKTDQVLLWVPAEENQHVSSQVRPETDIFIVINKAGVSLR
jgi:hypothetical protein